MKRALNRENERNVEKANYTDTRLVQAFSWSQELDFITPDKKSHTVTDSKSICSDLHFIYEYIWAWLQLQSASYSFNVLDVTSMQYTY